MAATIGNGWGNVRHTDLGEQYDNYNTTGDLVQADFVLATGVIGMRKFPVGTKLFHAGEIAGVAGGCGLVRHKEDAGTYADWFTLDGVTAGTVVSG